MSLAKRFISVKGINFKLNLSNLSHFFSQDVTTVTKRLRYQLKFVVNQASSSTRWLGVVTPLKKEKIGNSENCENRPVTRLVCAWAHSLEVINRET